MASLLFLSLFSIGAFAQKKAAARAQYEKAEKQRTALEGKPQKERTLKEYTQLVAAYRRVYHLSPQSPEVTTSLQAVGEMYQEMGRLFDEKYFQSAVDAYQFLLHEYPTSRFRDDALFTIAQIQQEDLGDTDLAEKTYQEFLKRFPRSSKAEQVKAALAEIAVEREKEKKPSSKAALAEERAKERKMPQVTGIRSWNAEHYTRIVISMDDYSVFLLPDPYRMVVDIYGEQFAVARTEAAKAEESPAKAASKEEAPPKRGSTRAAAEKKEPDEAPRTRPSEPAPGHSAKKGAEPEKPSKSVPTSSAKAEKGGKTSGALASAKPPAPTRNGQMDMTRVLGLKIGRIVIDAGHGGHDTGTVGPSGLMEKDLCLDVALRLGKMILEKLPGTEVIYTREDD
ncbi:MAG: N-acetylmuramoyl-L-alanine amidase, partial [Acidobacteria bacterium]|nr:N-acetylmuramoyl-L-alanine amidase [Acidobacteriota bacterium]